MEKRTKFGEIKRNEVKISIKLSSAIECVGQLSDLHLSKFQTENRGIGELKICETELKNVKETIKQLRKEEELNKKNVKENVVVDLSAKVFQYGNAVKNFFQKYILLLE